MSLIPRRSTNRPIVLVSLLVLALLVGCGQDDPAPVPTPTLTTDSDVVLRPPTEAVSTPDGPSDLTAIQGTMTVIAGEPSCLPGGDQRLTRTEYLAALDCSRRDFVWPPGRYPDLAPLLTSSGEYDGTMYRQGQEHTVVAGVNACAWYFAWLDGRQTGDASLEADALEVITEVLPNLTTLIQDMPAELESTSSLAYSDEIAQATTLGDTTRIQTAASQGCAGMDQVWTAGP